MTGRKKRPIIYFADYPDFQPDLTPQECIRAGIFGGIYFNPRGGKPGILGRSVDIDHNEFPPEWFRGVAPRLYRARVYDASVNKYGVVSGSDQATWERKGWIDQRDPRGWFQWYCRFFEGRRMDDDARQIRRWKGVAGASGRWKRDLERKIEQAPDSEKATVSPVVRQLLLHWAVNAECIMKR